MNLQERIEIRPDVLHGMPVIKGTRISVELILRKLAANIPAEQIAAEHPQITTEDVYAAEAFGVDNPVEITAFG